MILLYFVFHFRHAFSRSLGDLVKKGLQFMIQLIDFGLRKEGSEEEQNEAIMIKSIWGVSLSWGIGMLTFECCIPFAAYPI
jgi:hypothetical protein